MKIFYILISLLCVPAQALEIILWQMTPQSAEVLLPVKSDSTPTQAIEEYLQKINESKKLTTLRETSDLAPYLVDRKLSAPAGNWRYFPSKLIRPQLVIVSNDLREIYPAPAGRRSIRDIERISKYNASAYVLPPLHDITLNAKEGREYRRKLMNVFDAQIILGGADIDPYLYKELPTHARGLNRKRDISELKFARAYLQNDAGASFGICRGHQMCSVALGKKLIQDIQIENDADLVHLKGKHEMKIHEGTEFSKLFNSKMITVNSLHHQSVDVSSGDPDYKIMGTSTDEIPVIEALEFRKHRGFTMQFHPELMNDFIGDTIIERFVVLAKKVREEKEGNLKLTCRELIGAFF